MANQTVYPYGTGGQLPSSVGIINDCVTGGADKALAAEQGKVLYGMIVNVEDRVFFNNGNSASWETGNLLNGSYTSRYANQIIFLPLSQEAKSVGTLHLTFGPTSTYNLNVYLSNSERTGYGSAVAGIATPSEAATRDISISGYNYICLVVWDKPSSETVKSLPLSITYKFEEGRYIQQGDSEDPGADLEIKDESDNVLVKFVGGHIRTRWFDSRYGNTKLNLSSIIVNCLGDSITYGYISSGVRANPTWPQGLSVNLGCNVNNYGVSATSICSGSSQSFVDRLNAMSESFIDMLIIAGGTNDYGDGRAFTIGSINDTPQAGTNFIAAFKYLIEQAINKYPSAIISVITPSRRSNESANAKGISLPMIVDAEIQVANYYGCPVYDMYHHGTLNPSISIHRTTFTSDGLHPNQAGYNRFFIPQISEFAKHHLEFI